MTSLKEADVCCGYPARNVSRSVSKKLSALHSTSPLGCPSVVLMATMHCFLQVVALARDQNGCRFLQRKFDEGGASAIGQVFPEILDHLVELMMDPFGNYLIQKLLDRCSEDQRLQASHISFENEKLSV